MEMEQTECSETSANKIQSPGNYPKERIQPSEPGERLKSRHLVLLLLFCSVVTCSQTKICNFLKAYFKNLFYDIQALLGTVKEVRFCQT
jgi:hypothetical protein